jgi:hypothetical protein
MPDGNGSRHAGSGAVLGWFAYQVVGWFAADLHEVGVACYMAQVNHRSVTEVRPNGQRLAETRRRGSELASGKSFTTAIPASATAGHSARLTANPGQVGALLLSFILVLWEVRRMGSNRDAGLQGVFGVGPRRAGSG